MSRHVGRQVGDILLSGLFFCRQNSVGESYPRHNFLRVCRNWYYTWYYIPCCEAFAVLPSPLPRCHHLRRAAVTSRSRQAAAAAAKLAPASEVLPPHFRRCRCLHFHRHHRRRFRRRCHRCIQLIVDCCVYPRHCCHRRCLRHRGSARWQNGGCRNHARRRRAANALSAVAAAAALLASCHCRQAAAATSTTATTALPPCFPPRCCRR